MPEPTNDPAPHLLRAYLRSIARIPALDAEQVSRLLREMRRLRRLAERSGSVRDFHAWKEVKRDVVVRHLRLVVGCSFRWRHAGVPLLDLIQEGNLGLMHAAENLDQRALSRAVLARQDVYLARPKVEVDIVQDALAVEELGHAGHAKQWDRGGDCRINLRFAIVHGYGDLPITSQE